jgi:methylmalonyl-CoA/ethylmalonyl-CoA epimerase
MTAAGLPSAHHVVFAVSPERMGAVSSVFTDLGFVFDTFVLEDVGLEVMLDWDRGIELVTPTRPQDHGVSEFLARNGEGVYSVVIRVGDAPSAEQLARRHGAVTRFRQHRQVGAHQLEEIELSVQGLSLTLLSTDLP